MCGIVDVWCHVSGIISPVWGWITIIFWALVSLVALSALYKVKQVFGWPGVVSVLAGALTLGAYRQGYRDADARKPPLVPVEDYERAIVESPKRKRKTLVDLFAEWGNR